ncbi:hypothetical protein EVG20_g4379 [Dentipellis fragilis]|uniref:Uncharacterized protein n=1 Tax=Dentipellis fragilis TaxID=205917 RepID=A0A4Y9YVU7_9AGAM|nr:hypothetical protein EVG20_g4379 [Dentipellis fragilis]
MHPWDPDLLQEHEDHVDFPSLRLLDVVDRFEDYLLFLEHIKVAPNTIVRLRSEHSTLAYGPHEHPIALSGVPPPPLFPQGLPLDKICILICDEGYVAMTGYSSNDIASGRELFTMEFKKPDVAPHVVDTMFVAWLNSTLAILPISNASILNFHVQGAFRQMQWWDLLSVFDNAREVDINAERAETFLDAMVGLWAASDDEQETLQFHPVLPMLEKLSLLRWGRTSRAMHTHLVECLEARERIPLPPATLCLEGCEWTNKVCNPLLDEIKQRVTIVELIWLDDEDE